MFRITNKGLSIRSRITIYVTICAIAVLAVASVITFKLFSTQFKQAIADNQYQCLSSMALQLDSQLLLAQRQLEYMAKEIDPSHLNSPEKLQMFLDGEKVAHSTFDAGFVIISAEGRILAATPVSLAARGEDYAFREYVMRTVTTGKPHNSTPFKTLTPPYEPHIAFSVPIKNSAGKTVALLAGLHNLLHGSFLQSLADHGDINSGYTFIFSLNRILVVHPDKSRIMEQIKPGMNRGFELAVNEGFEGSLENVNSRGVAGITSFKRLKRAEWYLASHAPITRLYQQLFTAEYQLVAVFALLGVAVTLVMWLVVGKIISPLQTVIDQIGSIHTRKGDERLLPDIYDGDLGRLSGAFNNMVAEFDLQQEALIMMQSEMQQQKAFAEGVLNKAAVPIFVLDVNHRIIVWNNAMEDLTGLRAEEMLGTNRQWTPFYAYERPVLADLVLSADQSHLEDLYGTYRLSQHVLGGLQGEGWLENVGGERRYLLFDAAPLFDAHDDKLGVIETLLDITERKQAEADLTKSREELQRKHNELSELFSQVESGKREWEDTMDSLSEMVLICDQFGVVNRCNRAVTTFTGLSYDEIVTVDCMELFARGGLEITGYDGTSGQLECEGGERHFELLSNELKKIGSDEIRGVVVTIHETTELLKMNEKLQQAYAELQQSQAQIFQQEKMASIGQLAAGVAHEINNPMGFISSNLSTMGKYMEKINTFEAALIKAVQDKGDTETVATLSDLRKKMKIDFILEDIKSLLDESRDGAERVRRIVQDLKSFSHVDEAECKPASINECLDTTLNMLRNEIKYVADVEREFDPDLPMLLCFPQQINQVFMNVLVNAAHAIEGHGVIKINTLRESDDIVVRISDTGKGISPENLTRVFEPFFTTKEVGKGTGLGLSISYDIIKKHGGVMNIESEVGVGTTFIIRLPLNHSFKVEEIKS